MKATKALDILLFVAAGVCCAQTPQPVRPQIPKADPAKYRQVRDAKGWKNPYLIVRRDGIEIVGVTPAGSAVSLALIEEELDRLPPSAWPYGLVVAVQQAGIQSGGDWELVLANRKKLIALLKRRGIAAELWPSG